MRLSTSWPNLTARCVTFLLPLVWARVVVSTECWWQNGTQLMIRLVSCPSLQVQGLDPRSLGNLVFSLVSWSSSLFDFSYFVFALSPPFFWFSGPRFGIIILLHRLYQLISWFRFFRWERRSPWPMLQASLSFSLVVDKCVSNSDSGFKQFADGHLIRSNGCRRIQIYVSWKLTMSFKLFWAVRWRRAGHFRCISGFLYKSWFNDFFGDTVIVKHPDNLQREWLW